MKKLRPEDIEFIPMPNNLSPEERAEAYARVKAAFSPEELQRLIDGEEGIPMEEVLKELEEIQSRQSASLIARWEIMGAFSLKSQKTLTKL